MTVTWHSLSHHALDDCYLMFATVMPSVIGDMCFMTGFCEMANGRWFSWNKAQGENSFPWGITIMETTKDFIR